MSQKQSCQFPYWSLMMGERSLQIEPAETRFHAYNNLRIGDHTAGDSLTNGIDERLAEERLL